MNIIPSKSICVLFTALCFCASFSMASEEKAPGSATEKVEKSKPKLEVSLELGKTTYNHYCTPCHGFKGDGNGFNAPELLVKPANHTDAKFMSERNDTKLFDTINLGGVEVAKSTLMPPWGGAFTSVTGNDADADTLIKSIVLYLRELCQCQATKNW